MVEAAVAGEIELDPESWKIIGIENDIKVAMIMVDITTVIEVVVVTALVGIMIDTTVAEDITVAEKEAEIIVVTIDMIATGVTLTIVLVKMTAGGIARKAWIMSRGRMMHNITMHIL